MCGLPCETRIDQGNTLNKLVHGAGNTWLLCVAGFLSLIAVINGEIDVLPVYLPMTKCALLRGKSNVKLFCK
jgi:hypothetical protein